MTTPPLGGQPDIIQITAQLIQENSQVSFNVGQGIVITTEDKIRICLMKHLAAMEKKNAWLAPFGILVTIIIVFPTTTFKDALLLSAEVWNAAFIIAGLIVFGWLVRTIVDGRTSSSLENVISSIKLKANDLNGQTIDTETVPPPTIG
jgi:hypothetical protein